MGKDNFEHDILKSFLYIIAIFIAIIGSYFVLNMIIGVNEKLQYLSNVLEMTNSQELANIRTFTWIFVIYIIVFWLSLIALPSQIGVLLDIHYNSDYNFLRHLLQFFGNVFIYFGIAVFFFYLNYSDNLNNIEWVRNYRMFIGVSFLIINVFHGLICVGVSKIQEKVYEDKTIPHYNFNEKTNKNEKDNSSTSSTLFCSNCGTSNMSTNKFCQNCGSQL
jgi:hypothetical protein